MPCARSFEAVHRIVLDLPEPAIESSLRILVEPFTSRATSLTGDVPHVTRLTGTNASERHHFSGRGRVRPVASAPSPSKRTRSARGASVRSAASPLSPRGDDCSQETVCTPAPPLAPAPPPLVYAYMSDPPSCTVHPYPSEGPMSPAHLVIRPKPAVAAHHPPKGASNFSFFATTLIHTPLSTLPYHLGTGTQLDTQMERHSISNKGGSPKQG